MRPVSRARAWRRPPTRPKAAEVALQLVGECVQIHGAIRYSDEHDMGLFFWRTMALVCTGGDALACRQSIGGDFAARACVVAGKRRNA